MTPKGADGRRSASDGASYGSVEKKKRAELLSHHTLVLRRPRERRGRQRRWRSTPAAELQWAAAAARFRRKGTAREAGKLGCG
jgi:hypothetical protein